jgi:hypothetical protein
MNIMVVAICPKCGKPTPDLKIGQWPGLCAECQGQESTIERFPPPTVDEPWTPPDAIDAGYQAYPTKLAPLDYYLVCDHHSVVARWQNDSRGWMLHMRDGFVRARHVADEIPWYGEFVLIDIGIEKDHGRTRLTQIKAYKLQEEFALMELVKSDAAILRTITGPAYLSEKQKEHVREFVKSIYLEHVWHNIDQLFEEP